MVIKVIALDIFGTVLSSIDVSGVMLPRKGIEKFFEKADSKGIKVVSSSDADTDGVKHALAVAGVDVRRFFDFYCLNHYPHKDYRQIISDFGILPEELLVVGDRDDKDVAGARDCRACWIKVPEYRDVRDEFDLSKINF